MKASALYLLVSAPAPRAALRPHIRPWETPACRPTPARPEAGQQGPIARPHPRAAPPMEAASLRRGSADGWPWAVALSVPGNSSQACPGALCYRPETGGCRAARSVPVNRSQFSQGRSYAGSRVFYSSFPGDFFFKRENSARPKGRRETRSNDSSRLRLRPERPRTGYDGLGSCSSTAFYYVYCFEDLHFF